MKVDKINKPRSIRLGANIDQLLESHIKKLNRKKIKTDPSKIIRKAVVQFLNSSDMKFDELINLKSELSEIRKNLKRVGGNLIWSSKSRHFLRLPFGQNNYFQILLGVVA